jgi:hypothetical protein
VRRELVGHPRPAACDRCACVGLRDAGRHEDRRRQRLVAAAALAQARGIRVSNHPWPEIGAQLLCLTPTAHWLEYANWWNAIIDSPLRIEEG